MAGANPVVRLAELSLAQARTDLEVALHRRPQVAHAARAAGLTHQQIGDQLGITEAGVRRMLDAHPGVGS